MMYERYDPQTKLTKVVHYHQVRVDVNSNSYVTAKQNWDKLDAMKVGDTEEIQGYTLKRIS